jgi:uncharacterized protein (TIGR00369 family)
MTAVTDRSDDDGLIVVDRDAVGSCFGCGQQNHQGLRLRFRRLDDGWVETRVRVPHHFCGVDTIVHGGIQATILDEVSGVAAQLALPETADATPCVTAELALRFRRMVSQTEPVTAVARVVRQDGTDFYIDAAIVDAAGDVLTSSSSRWVQLKA